MENVLATKSLSKHYGRNKVLENVTMHIPKGAIYGLIGKNGAGKTTLIRVLTGLQNPTNGMYQLFGTGSYKRDINKVRRRVGAVVEEPALYQDMSATENLREQYRILGLPDYSGIDTLLELVGLEKTGKKKVKNFSFGMKQRLGIAMALAGDPDLLILDEPVNGLDPQGIIEIRELILRLNREKQITILISSHILDELSKLVTHYGFLDKGELIKEISAQELDDIFHKSKRVHVNRVSPLITFLDTRDLNYQVVDENTIDIYDDIQINELVRELDKRDCEILSINDNNESLESYFIKLTGGQEQ